MKKEEIFERLWLDYTTKNPSVKKVYDLFISEGEVVQNDHIAFRTFNHPKTNINVVVKTFIKAGYKFKKDYHFEEKKLYAKHYEHPDDPSAPRIFISELKVDEFSKFLQIVVDGIAHGIPGKYLHPRYMIFSGNEWGIPSYEKYERLKEESEYAAWLYVFGFCANHFTVNVNALKKHDSIEKVNQFIKGNGFFINDSGGEIKGNPSELLKQSSIKSDLIPVKFQEGEYNIPGCYYEFAKRYPDAEGNLFSGFIAKSADKIFESTDFYKKDEE